MDWLWRVGHSNGQFVDETEYVDPYLATADVASLLGDGLMVC